MELRYQLTREDIAAYQFAVRSRVAATLTRTGGAWKHVLFGSAFGVALLGFAVAAAVAIPHLTHRRFGAVEMAAGFLLGVAFLLASIWLNYYRMRGVLLKPNGPGLSLHTLILEPQRLRIAGSHFDHVFHWPVFEELTELKTILVLWIEPGQGLVIPRSAFADEAGVTAFADEVRGHITNARLSRPS